MRKGLAKIRGAGYVLWHAKHELMHVLLGLSWAWFLREIWGEFNVKWVISAAVGSLLPDADHLLYFFTYGKKEPYTRKIWSMIKDRKWRSLTYFIEHGHKHNTNLTYHNVYFMFFLFALCAISYFYDWRTSVVFVGAMLTHYLFDIVDDIIILGHLNPNWKRWGNGKTKSLIPKFK